MAGMTDEEKEYEAMKLVSLLDKMARQGVVQPMRIGLDGKPRPVDNVLQMREEVVNEAASSSATSSNSNATSGVRKKHNEKRDDSVDDVEWEIWLVRQQIETGDLFRWKLYSSLDFAFR